MRKISVFLLLIAVLFFNVNFVRAEDKCEKKAPANKPDLFQIDTSNTTATLHFSPPNDEFTKFRIVYGMSEGDERYGVDYVQGSTTGALTYIVNDLSAGTTYYFKVRADNDCADGQWSAWKSATTKGGSATSNSTNGTSSISKLPTAGNILGFSFLGIIAIGILALGFIL